jgi:hypothetical protein
MNWRANTRGVLRTLASPDEQRSYQAAVPFVHVPVELFCQWDAAYEPGVAAFELAFRSDERAALAAFNVVFRRGLEALPDPMPDLEGYIASVVGVELARAATMALQSLEGSPDAESGATRDPA